MTEQTPPPLTPTEQMQRIREAVLSTDSQSPFQARLMLMRQFNSLDVLRKRLAVLEGQMTIQVHPFTSHAPLIGRLIVRFRRLWNWMSTKWYVLPMLQQQNRYNASVTHALRELTADIEVLTLSAQEMQARLDTLEHRLEPPARRS